MYKKIIKLYQELHGKNFKTEDIPGNQEQIKKELKKIQSEQGLDQNLDQSSNINQGYGLFMGRCQPFHQGHNYIIQDIIRDGRTPVIILGSTNRTDENNPLTPEQRSEIIRNIYPDIKIIYSEDSDCWENWIKQIKGSLRDSFVPLEDCLLYSHVKPGDVFDFTIKGKEYKNEPYTTALRLHGFKIKDLESFCSGDCTIHAGDIRTNKPGSKFDIDARTFIYLKNLGWF